MNLKIGYIPSLSDGLSSFSPSAGLQEFGKIFQVPKPPDFVRLTPSLSMSIP
jgi:hypothetical protein